MMAETIGELWLSLVGDLCPQLYLIYENNVFEANFFFFLKKKLNQINK